jgi:hypothetical protein
VLCASALPPWLALLISSQSFHEAVVLFLVGLKFAYIAALTVSLAGCLVFGWMLNRARRRGTPRKGAARGLVACVSCLLAIALGEAVITATSAWKQWRSARSMARSGLAEDLELPTEFAPTGDADEVTLVVLGESSAEGYPCREWLSIGRLLAWQLGRSIPSRRFRAEIVAHAGDTLEKQHRKLAGLVHRPDAIIVYCGHNEFAARYPTERDVGHYRNADARFPVWAIAGRLVDYSPLCGLIEKVADGHRVGVAPRLGSTRPLVDVPIFSEYEYAERLADFHRRLEVIVTYCKRIGALPILVVPASNDADFEPNRSYLARGTSPEEREAIAREFLMVRREEDADPAASLVRYRSLLSRQPGFAEAHFRLARLLQRAGNWDEAYRHFVAARDCDGLPIRCPSSLQQAYRDVASRHGGILVDGQKLFHEIGNQGLLDDRLFLDAMHPTVRGHIALAQAILEALYARRSFGWAPGAAAPVLDPLECVAHFGIDSAVWKTLCERGAMFYYGFGSSRYEVSERQAKQRAFLEAARRITSGEAPEAVGLLNVGFARGTSLTSRPPLQ